MDRFFLFALVSFLPSMTGIAQQTQAGAILDSPLSSHQQQTQTQSTNPLQSSLTMYLLLQKKSVVFPDLATARGPLSGWHKCELAANNSVAPSTIGAGLLGSAYGRPETSQKQASWIWPGTWRIVSA
jgi:hypothetical protein